MVWGMSEGPAREDVVYRAAVHFTFISPSGVARLSLNFILSWQDAG